MMNRNNLRSASAVQLLCSTALGLVLANLASANPLDGTVAAGTATIVKTNSQTLTINQTTQKAVINWRSFSIGQGETTNFIQPTASAIVLNRVTGVDPSSIMGNLTANGQVWLINPNGIAFGKTARVDVAGLLVTTIDIADRDFMFGNYRFSGLGNPSAMVTNAGQITVHNAGLAALVAPGVENSGIIQANLGQIQLSSAAAFTVDLYGDGLFNFALDKQVTQAIKQPDGTKPTAAVSNSGQLIANGGRILLTANAAKSVVDHSINMTGYVQATSASVSSTGEIVLDGGAEGTVQVAGTVDASGTGANQTGGTVRVTGQDVQLAQTSRIDASGASGGSVSVISQGRTAASGTIVAKNMTTHGSGGTVETSGHELSVSGTVDAGHGGNWLLDPYDLTVDATAASTIDYSLSAGTNVKLQTTADSASGPGIQNTSGNGDINIASPLSWSTLATLTISAYRNIDFNANVTVSGGGTLSLMTGTGVSGDYIIANGSNISFTGGSSSGASFSVNGTNYTLLYSMADVQNINVSNSTLAGDFALAISLDATSTLSWTPIGSDPYLGGTVFTGNFTGLGHTISNLNINPSSTRMIGLFGESNGTIRDVGVVGGSVSDGSYAGGLTSYVGGLVGVNGGIISNSYATGVVGGNHYGSFVGGLVGSNGGTINQSYATGAVSGTNELGGLVGWNNGLVTLSYATGNVVSSGGHDVGGLVGASGAYSSAPITRSYATGTVTDPLGNNVGGLVGYLDGQVGQSYATGAVTGGQNVGGLIGENGGYYGGGTVTQSYATGAVSGQSAVGGFVGLNDGLGSINPGSGGVITGGYWDTQTSARNNGTGTDNNNQSGNVIGLTTAQLKSGLPTGFDSNVWSISATVNNGYPYLKGMAVVAAPTLITLNWRVENISSTYGTLASFGTVTFNNSSGATIPLSSGSYTFGLFQNGNQVTLSSALNAGQYQEEVLTLAGSAASIYSLASSGNMIGTLTINPKTLTWSVADATSTYGTTPSLVSVISLFGVLGSDDVTGVVGLHNAVADFDPSSPNLPVGTYTEYVLRLTGISATNYTRASSGTTGTLTVTSPPGYGSFVGQSTTPISPSNTSTTTPSTTGSSATNTGTTNTTTIVSSGTSTTGTSASNSSSNGNPSTSSSITASTAGQTSLDGFTFATISQLNTDSSVYGSLSGGAKDTTNGLLRKNETCLAAVYVMIARAAGDTTATISSFWSDTNGALTSKLATIPGGHKITLSYTGKLENSSFTGVSANIPRLNATSNGQYAVLTALNSGPVLIGGSISTSANSTGKEAHWMLGVGAATDSNGKTAIVANDPWTGTKVKIEPATGKVVDIMDPITGVYYPLISVINKAPLSQSALNDFGTLPTTTANKPSYSALTSFDASGTNGGYVGVTIK